MTVIFGIDTTQQLTTTMVRNAMEEYFYELNKEIKKEDFYVLKSSQEIEAIQRSEAMFILNYFFEKINANYRNPTKTDLQKVLKKCQEYVKLEVPPKIIKEKTRLMEQLINKL